MVIWHETFLAVAHPSLPDFLWRRVDRLSVVGRNRSEWIYQPLHEGDVVPSRLIEGRECYHQAWNVYATGDFKEAIRLFEAARERFGGDTVSDVMILRCQNFLKNPPPSDWDGSFHAVSK